MPRECQNWLKPTESTGCGGIGRGDLHLIACISLTIFQHTVREGVGDLKIRIGVRKNQQRVQVERANGKGDAGAGGEDGRREGEANWLMKRSRKSDCSQSHAKPRGPAVWDHWFRAEKTGGAEGGSLGLKSAELDQRTPVSCMPSRNTSIDETRPPSASPLRTTSVSVGQQDAGCARRARM